MGAFDVVPTLSSVGLLCLGQTGNQQGNSQNRNQLISLHKSPLSRIRKDVFSFQEGISDEKFHTLFQSQINPLGKAPKPAQIQASDLLIWVSVKHTYSDRFLGDFFCNRLTKDCAAPGTDTFPSNTISRAEIFWP